MASKADLNKVVTLKDLLIDEDVWGFWDTREDSRAGLPFTNGVCFLVDSSRIFLVGADKGAERGADKA